MLATLSPANVSTIAKLNFIVTGERRAGVAVLGSVLNQTSQTVCHLDLLFSDYGEPFSQDPAVQPKTQDYIRRKAHEAYFGACKDPKKLPEWLTLNPQNVGNPHRYLVDQVFDHAMNDEARVGVRCLYEDLLQYDLFDLVESRWREGDFCVINVVRNPIACLVSRLQAQRSGLWRECGDTDSHAIPTPVTLYPEDVVAVVRRFEASRRKLQNACRDMLEIKYIDLALNFDRVAEQTFEFLEMDQQRIPQPSLRRLRNRDMRARISNFASIRFDLPSDVAKYLDEDLF